MRRTRHQCFTLIELLMVVAIIALLAAVLMPALVKAKSSAKFTKCTNNLKQIGAAMHVYADDYEGSLPKPTGNVYPSTEVRWAGLINPYLNMNWTNNWFIPPQLVCPETTPGGYRCGMNYYYSGKISRKRYPERTVMIGDASGSFYLFPNRWRKNYVFRHTRPDYGYFNGLHGDVHVERYKYGDGRIHTPHETCRAFNPSKQ